jgi:hypothetical protein
MSNYMTQLEAWWNQAESIKVNAMTTAGPIDSKGNVSVSFESTDEIKIWKSELTIAQTELRALKREVTEEQRIIRQNYAEKTSSMRAVNTATSVAIGRRGFMGRAVRGMQSQGVRNVQNEKAQVMAQFDTVKTHIDRCILTLTKAKQEVTKLAQQAS